MREDLGEEPVEQQFFAIARMGHVQLGPMGPDIFQQATGQAPTCDDLHRVNCTEAGSVGHFMCGWCDECGLPRFMCGHLARRTEEAE